MGEDTKASGADIEHLRELDRIARSGGMGRATEAMIELHDAVPGLLDELAEMREMATRNADGWDRCDRERSAALARVRRMQEAVIAGLAHADRGDERAIRAELEDGDLDDDGSGRP